MSEVIATIGLGALLPVFLVAIVVMANRSARKGRRYIGTEDPIEAYKDGLTSIYSSPWSAWRGYLPGGGWRWRVKMQSQLDSERAEDRRRRRRAKARGQ